MSSGRTPRRENELLAKYLRFARPTLDGLGLCFKHADQSKGVPDVSWTANKLTSWWEFKHDVGDGISMSGCELQWTNMRRLEAAGYARYVVFAQHGHDKSIAIVKPSQVGRSGLYVPVQWRDTWDYEWLLQRMKSAHGL